MDGWVGGWLCSGRSPEKILEYRARRVGGMGKMGDLGGNGEGRRRKKWWKGEDFFWEKKFFLYHREVHTMGATEYCY